MPYDVRAIANFVLRRAADRGLPITNMQINKIVFFLHADFLGAFRRPLVTAKIEAWEHGPVFRELYSEFKVFGDSPIAKFATALSPKSGRREIAAAAITAEEEAFLLTAVDRYTPLSASALRAQSHISGGPWDTVWNHDTTTNATMRITDEAILEWFGRSAKH